MRPVSVLLLLAACTGEGPKPDTDDGCTLMAWYPDEDDDGYGVAGDPLEACIAPAGYTDNGDDCDDGDAGINPRATERCDGVDNDCDGFIDAADTNVTGLVTYFADDDGDGYGDPDRTLADCDPPAGYVTNDDDCNDDLETANPGAFEICDGADNDCDGLVDDGDNVVYEAPRWYPDYDLDTWGGNYGDIVQCEQPSGHVSRGGDCEDTNPAIRPDAVEVCDLIDNDCDLLVDDDDDTLDLATAESWYPDGDGDDYGDASREVIACYQPDGYGQEPGDCDDTDADSYPGAPEYCNDGVDQDCSGADSECNTLDASAYWYGVTADQAGATLAWAGDVTGDGVPEFLVGAPDADGSATEAGRVYLVDGTAGPGDLSAARAVFLGDLSGDSLGRAVAAGGDIDGDGVGDLALGAHRHDRGGSSAGVVYLLSGDSTGEVDLFPSGAIAGIYGATSGDTFGRAVAFVGDQDGDGLDDLLVGAPGADYAADLAGAAYLVSSTATGFGAVVGTSPRFDGEGIGDQAGETVVGLGDVDGDGFSDFAIGAPDQDSGAAYAGAAYVVLGPVTTGFGLAAADGKWYGAAVTDRCGSALAAPGDTNGDGLDDLLVGCPGVDEGWYDAGAAGLVLGPATGTGPLDTAGAWMSGEVPDSYAGAAVGGAGDVDGDGLADLLVAAPGEASGGATAGSVYLVRGGVTGAISLADADAQWIGLTAGDELADAVLGGADLDGDGALDYLFSSTDPTAAREGRVYFVAGPGL